MPTVSQHSDIHPPSSVEERAPAGTTNLADRISERIKKRLGPRIRDLRVTVNGKTVSITGRCATYHSKQLAQHAALGVIEDEQLENAIEVAIAK